MADKRRTTGDQPTPETADREAAAAAPVVMPSVERVQQELASATSLDDFFGKEGIFAPVCEHDRAAYCMAWMCPNWPNVR
jgi:hypothetical protein